MKKATAAALVLALACGPSLAYDSAVLERGRAAARALNETLKNKLLASMKESGPSAALAVCTYQAQAMTAEVERNHDVRVKRTSLKLRNPKNAPDAYERDLLSRLADRHREGKLPEEVMEERREGGERIYLYSKPIVVGPRCLTCHGREEEIPADVKRELEVRYPGDNATGYKVGDLRGIVSVIIRAK